MVQQRRRGGASSISKIIKFMNDILKLGSGLESGNPEKVVDLKGMRTGAVACQMFDIIYPDAVKVRTGGTGCSFCSLVP